MKYAPNPQTLTTSTNRGNFGRPRRRAKAWLVGKVLAVGVLLLWGLAVPSSAQMTFMGEDLHNSSSTRIPATPNADSAQADWQSNIEGNSVEGFEGLQPGSGNGLNLTFSGSAGSIGATLWSGGSLSIVNRPTGAVAGRYPTEGDQFLQADAADFRIDFDRPISAFSFKGVDIGDFSGALSLELTLDKGGTVVLPVGNTIGTSGNTDGSVLFFGFYETENAYTSISFLNTDDSDIFAFDEMTIADIRQVVGQSKRSDRIEVTDGSAILSTLTRGLPMAAAQREILLGVGRTTTRDLNGRLFRMRSRANSAAAEPAPEGAPDEDGSSREWEIFASGEFNDLETDDIGDVRGFDSETYSGTVGAELCLSPNFTFGIGGTYIESDNRVKGQVGSVDVTGCAVSPYVSAFWDGLFADILYSWGIFESEIGRDTGFGPTARAEPDAEHHAVELNVGYNMALGSLVTGPIAGLEYIHGHLEGYTESGGGNMNLRVDSQSYQSWISRLGWQASCRVGAITPQVRASWDHQNLDNTETVSAALVTSPYGIIEDGRYTSVGSFSASAPTAHPGRDYVNCGGGIMIEITDRARLIVDYEGHFGRNNASAHYAGARFSTPF